MNDDYKAVSWKIMGRRADGSTKVFIGVTKLETGTPPPLPLLLADTLKVLSRETPDVFVALELHAATVLPKEEPLLAMEGS